MKTIARFILGIVAFVAFIAMLGGLVIAFVPYSLLTPELGKQGVHLQLQGVGVAIVAFVVLSVTCMFRDLFD